ncbi:hypothetical protein YA0871_15125 [Pseudomonas paralactis]|uniref:Lipoprotein n=1 Tax=Pseudomonas paralactis TaxID=1615673 RepID=A0ABS0V496_9PSED|nr:hypothetical protein [Pseudomonas paralactis]MBI6633997.1 hypothetical protein [Pseudomonas paralactis]
MLQRLTLLVPLMIMLSLCGCFSSHAAQAGMITAMMAAEFTNAADPFRIPLPIDLPLRAQRVQQALFSRCCCTDAVHIR